MPLTATVYYWSGSGGSANAGFSFEASRYNEIYAGDHMQVSALVCLPCIKFWCMQALAMKALEPLFQNKCYFHLTSWAIGLHRTYRKFLAISIGIDLLVCPIQTGQFLVVHKWNRPMQKPPLCLGSNPNIVGYADFPRFQTKSWIEADNVLFQVTECSKTEYAKPQWNGGIGAASAKLELNASGVNDVYSGQSVQMAALQCLVCIKL